MTSESDKILFAQTQLFVLRPNTLKLLGDYFNRPMVLQTIKGLSRDWRGLASIANLGIEETKLIEKESKQTKHGYNPTKQIISSWSKRNDKRTGRKVTVWDLITDVIEQLDRDEWIEDTHVKELIKSDCLSAKGYFGNITRERIERVDLLKTLTLNDVAALANGNSLITYDVIVLHGDDRPDQEFAEDIIERLEMVGLKVFAPERDLVAGTVENAASCHIIKARCKTAIAVFSSSFFPSKESEFLSSFAQYCGIRTKNKIVPIIFGSSINIPSMFQKYSKLVYKPHPDVVNFWRRLIVDTLKVQGTLSKKLKEYKKYSITDQQLQADDKLQDPSVSVVS